MSITGSGRCNLNNIFAKRGNFPSHFLTDCAADKSGLIFYPLEFGGIKDGVIDLLSDARDRPKPSLV